MTQPTAFQPPVDHIPYGGQQVIVVGCGSNPATHPGAPHRIPLGNLNNGQDVNIGLGLAYTMDINAAMLPHREGSFWIADHTEDLPGSRFRVIYFENLPGNLFSNRGWCLTAMRSAHRLLEPGGWVIVRTGAGMNAPGGLLHVAMQDVFTAVNTRVNADQWGVTQDLRAQK